MCISIVDANFAGKQNCRCVGRDRFNLFDHTRAIYTGHDEIAEHKVYAARAKSFNRLLTIVAGNHTIAAGLQQDFPNGERLLIIVDAQNCFLWFHVSRDRPGMSQGARKEFGCGSSCVRYRSDRNPMQRAPIRKVARMLMAHKCSLKKMRGYAFARDSLERRIFSIEKFTAHHFHRVAADAHVYHTVIFIFIGPNENSTWPLYLDALSDQHLLVGGCDPMLHHP